MFIYPNMEFDDNLKHERLDFGVQNICLAHVSNVGASASSPFPLCLWISKENVLHLGDSWSSCWKGGLFRSSG